MSFSADIPIRNAKNGGLLRMHRYLWQRGLLLKLLIVCLNAEIPPPPTPRREISPYTDIRHELQQHNLLFT